MPKLAITHGRLLQKSTVPRASGRGTVDRFFGGVLLAPFDRRVKLEMFQRHPIRGNHFRVSGQLRVWAKKTSYTGMWSGFGLLLSRKFSKKSSESASATARCLSSGIVAVMFSNHSNTVVPPPPLLVDSREAARMLSISPRKLWDLTNRGEIPSLKIDRCVRYSRSDLDAWVVKKSKKHED